MADLLACAYKCIKGGGYHRLLRYFFLLECPAWGSVSLLVGCIAAYPGLRGIQCKQIYTHERIRLMLTGAQVRSFHLRGRDCGFSGEKDSLGVLYTGSCADSGCGSTFSSPHRRSPGCSSGRAAAALHPGRPRRRAQGSFFPPRRQHLCPQFA